MKTRPHKNYISPSYEETTKRFSEIGYGGPWNYKGVKKIADLASHVLAGNNVESGIVEASAHERDFVRTVPWEKLTGTTPLEKAASLIAIIDTFETTPKPGEIEEKLDLFSKYFQTPLVETSIKETVKLTPKQLALLKKVAVISTKGKIKSQKPLDKRVGQQLTSYNQVGRPLSVTSFVLPTFQMKLVTKQLLISEQEKATKQSLLLLIDVSTSMKDDSEKLKWVAAILADRLLAVYENKAELLILPFGSKALWERKKTVKTKERAKFYLDKLMQGKLPLHINQGATDIQKVVKQVEKELKGKWQTVIINDGQDYIDPSFKPKFETHAFILGQDNQELKTVITNSGGHFERFL